MPSIITLPARANSVTFSVEEVREVADLLSRAESGNGIALDGEHKTENKARGRGVKMADAINTRYGVKPRVHSIDAGEGAFVAAVSLKDEDAEPLTVALDAEDAAAADAADTPAEGEPDAQDAPKGKGK